MTTLSEFEQSLGATLAHLYDARWRPPLEIWQAMGCNLQQGVQALWAAVTRSIEDMKPAPDVPRDANIQRMYTLLTLRYTQRLSQEDAAERLGMTTRHLRREQSEAIQALARQIWDQRDMSVETTNYRTSLTDRNEWQTQVLREIESLDEVNPCAISDLDKVFAELAPMTTVLAKRRDIRLEIDDLASPLVVATHPSALRQAFITAISQLFDLTVPQAGTIRVSAVQQAQRIQITFKGHPVLPDRLLNTESMTEFLAPSGGSVLLVPEAGDGSISLHMLLPAVDQAVLVVDDNTDMTHLYRRYTIGTKYHVLNVKRGSEALDVIKSCHPAIIVLDVMLPDTDGWTLLSHLQTDPATAAIPTIICSVVKEPDLARMIGATGYIQKPVQRQQFLEALDRAISHSPS